MDKVKLQKLLNRLSVNDKAFLLNDLRRLKYTNTPYMNSKLSDLIKCKIDEWVKEHLIWEELGIYYKEYIDWIPGVGSFANPMRIEIAIDINIHSYVKSLEV